MKAIEIKPNSFCKGVERAIKIIKNVLDNPLTKKPIYMLGFLVHNRYVVNAFDGIKVITSNYEKALSSIDSGTVIITAHGACPRIYEILKEKKLDIVDTTCVNVKRIHQSISAYLENGYEIYVIGNKDHPEIQGYLGISTHVHIYNNQNLEKRSFITTQTTLVKDYVTKTLSDIEKKYPSVICNDDVCNATTNRQKAVLDKINDFDLFIIIGDTLSNNCRSLYDLVISHNKKAILINDVNDLNKYDISSFDKIGVTAGASTPKAILLEVIDIINSHKPFKSNLTKFDYLNII